MPKRFLDYRKESRTSWGTTKPDGDLSNVSLEQIQLGCMLRIADSCELMAKDRAELENKCIFLKQLADQRLAEIETLKKANASYKGKYNRIKRQLERKEGECTSEK